MHVVVAPDTFKGSLTAAGPPPGGARARGGAPGAQVVEHPVADGGEGTVDPVLRHGFTPAAARVRGPLGGRSRRRSPSATATPRSWRWRRPPGSAGCPARRDDATARAASTAGVGELVAAALDRGVRRVRPRDRRQRDHRRRGGRGARPSVRG